MTAMTTTMAAGQTRATEPPVTVVVDGVALQPGQAIARKSRPVAFRRSA